MRITETSLYNQKLHCSLTVDIINWNCWQLFIVLVCSIQQFSPKWSCALKSRFQCFNGAQWDVTDCWSAWITINNGLEWISGYATNANTFFFKSWMAVVWCMMNWYNVISIRQLILTPLYSSVSHLCADHCCYDDGFLSRNDNTSLNHFIITFIPPPRHHLHHPHLLCKQLCVSSSRFRAASVWITNRETKYIERGEV